MYHVIVVPEPSEFRPPYRWRVSGPQLLSAGIALTVEGAWRRPRLPAERPVAA